MNNLQNEKKRHKFETVFFIPTLKDTKLKFRLSIVSLDKFEATYINGKYNKIMIIYDENKIKELIRFA